MFVLLEQLFARNNDHIHSKLQHKHLCICVHCMYFICCVYTVQVILQKVITAYTNYELSLF